MLRLLSFLFFIFVCFTAVLTHLGTRLTSYLSYRYICVSFNTFCKCLYIQLNVPCQLHVFGQGGKLVPVQYTFPVQYLDGFFSAREWDSNIDMNATDEIVEQIPRQSGCHSRRCESCIICTVISILNFSMCTPSEEYKIVHFNVSFSNQPLASVWPNPHIVWCELKFPIRTDLLALVSDSANVAQTGYVVRAPEAFLPLRLLFVTCCLKWIVSTFIAFLIIIITHP